MQHKPRSVAPIGVPVAVGAADAQLGHGVGVGCGPPRAGELEARLEHMAVAAAVVSTMGTMLRRPRRRCAWGLWRATGRRGPAARRRAGRRGAGWCAARARRSPPPRNVLHFGRGGRYGGVGAVVEQDALEPARAPAVPQHSPAIFHATMVNFGSTICGQIFDNHLGKEVHNRVPMLRP